MRPPRPRLGVAGLTAALGAGAAALAGVPEVPVAEVPVAEVPVPAGPAEPAARRGDWGGSARPAGGSGRTRPSATTSLARRTRRFTPSGTRNFRSEEHTSELQS